MDAPGDVTPGTALDVFCRAARQVALYTASHPAALAALEDAMTAIEAALNGRTRATLSLSSDTLLWDGRPLAHRSPSVKELHQRMHQRMIAAVVFHAGIQREDLAALLDVLTRDPRELEQAGGAAKYMQAQAVHHVNVEEVDYSQYLRESEIQWLKTISDETTVGGSAIQHLVGVCLANAGIRQPHDQRGPLAAASRPALVDFGLPFVPAGLQEAVDREASGAESAAEQTPDIPPEDCLAISLANVIQRSGELAAAAPGALNQWIEQVAGAVRRLTPPLRARVFRAPVVIAEGAPDFLSEVAKVFTAAEIVNIILAHPEAVVKEPSPQLALLLRRIVPTQQRRTDVEPMLHATLLSRGMTEDSYRNVVGLLLDHVNRDKPETAHALEKRLTALTANRGASQRREDIADLLATLEHSSITEARLLMFEELVDMDHEPAQFLDLTHYLEQEAAGFASAGDTERLIRVIHALERQVQPDSPRPESYRSVASRALRHIGTEAAVARLADALQQGTAEQKCGIARLLGHLGDRAVPVLVETIRSADSPEVQRAAIMAIARMGGEGDRAIQSILSGRDLDLGLACLKILGEANDDSLVKHLAAVLDHPDWRLKSELVRLLANCEGPYAEHILVRALLDNNLRVRTQAAESLGLRRATSAVGALSMAAERGPLHGDAFLFRKAAVIALGRIGSHEAACSLIRVLGKGSPIFRDNSDSLRCQAAAALAEISSLEAFEALRRGQSDRRPRVRDACREAAERWASTHTTRSDIAGATLA